MQLRRVGTGVRPRFLQVLHRLFEWFCGLERLPEYESPEEKKGALIGQYTGEIISDHDDAERRGRVYDKQKISYLFNMTTETEIDATRIGNKLRYINHSENVNCVPKILRVDGDVLVGIFAQRDIVAFEELLFDYGSTFTADINKGAKRPRNNPTAAMKSGTKTKSRNSDEDGDESMRSGGESSAVPSDDENDKDFQA